MTNVGHGRHSSVGDLYHNGLTSIQLALSFIDIQLSKTGRVNVAKEDTLDHSARLWEDRRAPQGGVDTLKIPEHCVNPLERLSSQGCHTL